MAGQQSFGQLLAERFEPGFTSYNPAMVRFGTHFLNPDGEPAPCSRACVRAAGHGPAASQRLGAQRRAQCGRSNLSAGGVRGGLGGSAASPILNPAARCAFQIRALA